MARRNQANRTAESAPGHNALTAAISNVAFVPAYSAPQDNLYTFKYTVTVTNNSSQSLTIARRFWDISWAGETIFVDAVTVGGRLMRQLMPGASFQYVTAVPFHEPAGWIRGRFFAALPSGGYYPATTETTHFIASEMDLKACINNRATAEDFAHSAKPAEIDIIRGAIETYNANRLSALFSTAELNVRASTRMRFDRLLLKMFFGEYRTMRDEGRPQSKLILSSIHSSYQDVEISDIFMLEDSGELSVTIRRAENIFRFINFVQSAKAAKEMASLSAPNPGLRTAIEALLSQQGVAEEARPSITEQMLVIIARETRPKWQGRLERGGKHATMTGPMFLKTVHADEIGPNGEVDMVLIRSIDQALMKAVATYVTQRKGRNGLGDAEGLKFIASRPPTRGNTKKPGPQS